MTMNVHSNRLITCAPVFLATALLASAGGVGTVQGALMVDVDRGGSATQQGFESFSVPPFDGGGNVETYSGQAALAATGDTITLTSVGTASPGVRKNTGGSFADLYQDFLSNADFTFSNLKPNTTYQVTVRAYDQQFGNNRVWDYTAEGTDIGSITNDTDTNSPPSLDFQKTSGAAMSDASGELTVVPSGDRDPRVNSISIAIPEPASLALLGVGGVMMLVGRRRRN